MRVGGSVTGPVEVALDRDPTHGLVAAAHQARDEHLGPLLGDLRRHGLAIDRWELYPAPFRIELAPDLRAALERRWLDGPA